MAELEKYEFTVDGEKFKADDMGWNYPQTDSEATTRTAENNLFRDVLPEMLTYKAIFKKPTEELASKLLVMRKKEEATVVFWSLRERTHITRKMMPVSDEITPKLLSNGEFICNDIEIRFVQTKGD